MTSLTHSNANALVCLLCARRFPHVQNGKRNQNGLHQLIDVSLDMKELEVQTIFWVCKRKMFQNYLVYVSIVVCTDARVNLFC